MQLKLLNNWFTRVLLICLLALVGIGGFCEHPYRTNPNLRLLVGDTTTKYDDIHCSNPVVSPDGKVIYYLCAPSDSVQGGFYGLGIGSVYSINVDGSNNTKVLDGIFKCTCNFV